MAWRCRRRGDSSPNAVYPGLPRDPNTDRPDAAWVITKGEAKKAVGFAGTAILAILGLLGDRVRMNRELDKKPVEIAQPRDVAGLARDLKENGDRDKALAEKVEVAVLTMQRAVEKVEAVTTRNAAETSEQFSQIRRSLDTLTAAVLRSGGRSAAPVPAPGPGASTGR